MNPCQQDYHSVALAFHPVASAVVMSHTLPHYQEQHFHLSCSALASQALVHSSLLQLYPITVAPKVQVHSSFAVVQLAVYFVMPEDLPQPIEALLRQLIKH